VGHPFHGANSHARQQTELSQGEAGRYAAAPGCFGPACGRLDHQAHETGEPDVAQVGGIEWRQAQVDASRACGRSGGRRATVDSGPDQGSRVRGAFDSRMRRCGECGSEVVRHGADGVVPGAGRSHPVREGLRSGWDDPAGRSSRISKRLAYTAERQG
jgi:hypothetical protein